MTVGELGRRMSSAEFSEWVAHDELTAQEREEAAARADQKTSVRKH